MNTIQIGNYQGFVVRGSADKIAKVMSMTETDFVSMKRYLQRHYNVPEGYSYMALLINVENKADTVNGTTRLWRTISQIFVKPSERAAIMEEAYLSSVNHGGTSVILPFRGLNEYFASVAGQDPTHPAVAIYAGIFTQFLNSYCFDPRIRSRVIPENESKQFTHLIQLEADTAQVLMNPENHLSRAALRGVRRVLGQVVDPQHQWLGKKGYLLTLAYRKPTDKYENEAYFLVARKPEWAEAVLPRGSPYRYREVVQKVPRQVPYVPDAPYVIDIADGADVVDVADVAISHEPDMASTIPFVPDTITTSA